MIILTLFPVQKLNKLIVDFEGLTRQPGYTAASTFSLVCLT